MMSLHGTVLIFSELFVSKSVSQSVGACSSVKWMKRRKLRRNQNGIALDALASFSARKLITD